jgi:hypothetical protein
MKFGECVMGEILKPYIIFHTEEELQPPGAQQGLNLLL